MAPVAAPPPPEAIQEADQQRQAAELLAVPLFAVRAAQAAPTAINVATLPQQLQLQSLETLHNIAAGLARGVMHTTLKAAAIAGISALVQHYRQTQSIQEAETELKVIEDAVVARLEDEVPKLREWMRTADLPNTSDLGRARLAARALSTRAYSVTAEEVAKRIPVPEGMEGLTLKKTWITRKDDKVRLLHRRLHGVTKLMNEDFWRWPDLGLSLSYPGDRSAPPDAWINCRCTLHLTWASKGAARDAVRTVAPLSPPT